MEPADKTRKAFRFGCGFVLGLVFFGLSSFAFLIEEGNAYIAAIFVAAIACGLAALWFGDAFWRAFGRWFSWFG